MDSDETATPVESNAEKGNDVKDNVKSRSTWLRLFFMLVVLLLYAVSRVVTGAVVVLQFFWVLFTGHTNKKLEHLGQSLATYTYQIIRYLTYNTEERPFPFDVDWPTGPPAA
jgi:fatty acid desaturase